MTKIIVLLLTLLGFSLIGSNGICADSQDILAVFTKPDTSGLHGIYFKAKYDGNWTEVQEISLSDRQELHPTIVQNENGDILLAWTRFTGTSGVICTRFYSSHNKSWQRVQTLKTATGSDMAPALGRDSSGTIWLAYSGTGTTGDDIYLARWEEREWSVPFQLNTVNDTPDIQPRFSYDNFGRLQIIWKGLLKGNYVRFASTLKNGTWSAEKRWQQAQQIERVQTGKEINSADISENLPPGSQISVLVGNAKYSTAKSINKDD